MNEDLRVRLPNIRFKPGDDVGPAGVIRAKLRGPVRSFLNHSDLVALKAREGVRFSGSQTVADLAWRPAQNFAIELDQQQLQWHSGRVNAVLSGGSVAIVGTDTGGVWVVNPLYGTGPITDEYQAIPLSDDWDDPNISSLSYAPGSHSEFFAATSQGALYYVELDVALGAMLPRRTTAIPLSPFFPNNIKKILIVSALERIVVATERNGIWWSQIPQPAVNVSQYTWLQALGLPMPNARFSSLAEGPDQSVVAAAWGSDVKGKHYGLFVGKWDGRDLTFQSSTINGLDSKEMLRTAVDSCAGNRSIMYAVAEAKGETILGVLRSDDGGTTWSKKTTPDKPDPGNAGWHNMCISVSPLDPEMVVLGWRTAGPYYSTDGANNWTHPGESNPSLHSDTHTLHFAGHGSNDALFVGSDGGVVLTRDSGQNYNGEYNRHLATLQFYPNNFDVSSRFPGLMAGGTQDNGNVYCNLRAKRPSWKSLEGGDGDVNRFIDSLGVLLRYNNTLTRADGTEYGNRVRIAAWKPYAWDPDDGYFDDTINVVPVDGNTDGLGYPLLETVRNPSWTRNQMKMYAVAVEPKNGSDWTGRVFGFFANDDGTSPTFSLLKDVGVAISSIGSFDGNKIHIGTASGRLLTLDPGKGTVTDLTPTAYGSGKFKNRIDAVATNRAFALHENGRLLHFDGTAWADTSGTTLATFTADPRIGSRRVFGADDRTVYVSNDDGHSWAVASQGLPARPHCRDLRIGTNKWGGHDLYLATYGRSVWVANIDYVQQSAPRPRMPEEVAKLFGGIAQGGPGGIFIDGHFIRVPPRGPEMDVLSALAIMNFAESMSPHLKQHIRATALAIIREIASNEIEASTRR